MEADIKQALVTIRDEIKQHRDESNKRQKLLFDEINKLSKTLDAVNDKADAAMSEALSAKTTANRASIDLEGADHSILAELNSVKKLMADTQAHIENEQKKERRARRAWRIAQPTIIAALTVLANQLMVPKSVDASSAQQKAPIVNVGDAGK